MASLIIQLHVCVLFFLRHLFTILTAVATAASIIMRYRFFIAIIYSLLVHANISAQVYSDCSVEGPLFVRVEQAAVFAGSLQQYFENEWKDAFRDFKGTIQIQILVDTGGKACCMSISNNYSHVPSAKIKKTVNKMTGWTAARQNNHAVNFSAALLITFDQPGLSVAYANEKQPILKPVINTNTSNNPDIIKDEKTKSTWKLWNFSNSMIPGNLSRNVAMDPNGSIWYCTDNGLVRIADDDQWQVFTGLTVPALAGKNGITYTTGMAVDKSGNVWVRSLGNIAKFDGKQWTVFDTSNSPLKLVQKISVDRDGIVWFCSFRGVVKYDGKIWTTYNTVNSAIASDNVKDVYTDANHTVWAATDKGINKFTNGNWSLLNNANTSLPENDITTIKGDTAGNIWVGAGIRDKSYLVKIDTASQLSIFPSAVIWNITVDNNVNKLWLATNGGGLVCFDGKTFTQYDKSNSIIPNNIVSDILIDKNGNKWISTFGGLVFTDRK